MMFICSCCRGEIIPKNRFSVLIECPYCHTSFRKIENDVTELGKIAQLPPDMSFIQIGTSGIFEEQPFKIVGRGKIGWEQGNWNEWVALFENGKIGYLADFVGHMSMSFPITPDHPISPFHLVVGKTLTLGNEVMTIVDIKEVKYIGFEGEIPFERTIGETGFSVDLRSETKKCAFIDNFHRCITVYSGIFVDPDDMKLEHIRLIDGW